MGEQGRKIVGRTFAGSNCDEYDKKLDGAECSPVLEGGAQADAAVIEGSEQRGER
jgi:hypothetical protein